MLLKNFCMAISVPIAGSSSDPKYNILQQTDGSYTSLRGTPSFICSLNGEFYNNVGTTDSVSSNYKGIILGTGTTPPHILGL